MSWHCTSLTHLVAAARLLGDRHHLHTADSSICRAAVHAGALDVGGGPVEARAAPGCSGYVGSAKNGVTTSAWGKYGASFYFPGHGGPDCAEQSR